MAALSRGSQLPLWSEHTAFVRRHRLRIGVLVVLGIVAGLAWSLAQPSTYSSTASVSLTPVPKYVLPTGTGLAAPEVSIDTDAQLLASPEVLGAVADVLGTDEPGAMRSLTVTAAPNSHVLHVTVTSASATAAAGAAEAAATALLRVRRSALGSLRPDQLRMLRLWISGQEDLLAREQRRGFVIPASNEQFAHVVALRGGLQELEEARLSPGEVLGQALPATAHDYANREVPVTSGAMAGLVAGCLLGLHRDRRRSPLPTSPGPRSRRSSRPPGAPLTHKDAHHAV